MPGPGSRAAYFGDKPPIDAASVDLTKKWHRYNMRRLAASGNLATPLTGIMLSTPMFFRKGEIITTLTLVSGGTAAVTPTHWWYALYDTAAIPNLLAQSADQLTAAFGADTAFPLDLASKIRIPADGHYWASFLMTAGTMPTLTGAVAPRAGAAAAIVTGEKALAVSSGSGLTGTAPATIATPTTLATVPLVVAT